MSIRQLTPSKIILLPIEGEMKQSYLDYSVSVIVARALADARDGLKPSQRRVLYSMYLLYLAPGSKHRKCAKICGDTSGDFHPHGESIVYPTLVRMAQDWLMRYPLVEGQGNFGSIDGDGAAAMRYTEARLALPAALILEDLEKQTVDFRANYDATKEEPVVLPGKFPNLLVNGSSGIAVGMTSNMAPNNLREVIDGICAYIDNPEIEPEELIQHILAPDFPTGGIIYGYEGVRQAYLTGKGTIQIRAKAEVDTLPSGKTAIIVTEIPYGVNKALMIERTAQLINDKKLDGISFLRDESDKDGLRVVYELKKGAVASVVLNNLFRKTPLQSSFTVNNVALVDDKPRLLTLKDLVAVYVNHRHEVVTRRLQYEKQLAEQKLHLLEGYMLLLEHQEAIIALIRKAADGQTAREELILTYGLSERQAKAILDLRLQRLTAIERQKVMDDHRDTQQQLEHLTSLLANRHLRMELIKEELRMMRAKMPSPRRSVIEYNATEMVLEDTIPNEQMVITVSRQGYIKRTALAHYRTQQRGGVGSRGAMTRKEDFTKHLFVASAHDYLLIFTDFGTVYWQRVYDLPEGGKNTQGRAIQNLIAIPEGDRVNTILRVEKLQDPAHTEGKYIIFCTRHGIVKKTPLSDYSRPRVNGIRAISTAEGDRLLDVQLTEGNHEVVLALRSGKAIRFPEQEVRPMGRTAMGVRGITLADKKDAVIGMVTISPAEKPAATLLVLSEHGFGKRSDLEDYRTTHRGGKGVKTLQITKKTGHLIGIRHVQDQDHLMILTTAGTMIRLEVAPIRVAGRDTQGVRLVRLRADDQIAALETIQPEEGEDQGEDQPEGGDSDRPEIS